MEATIWQVGSGEGVKKVLAEISLGKEVSVSRRDGRRRHGAGPPLTPRGSPPSGDPLRLLGVRPEGAAHLHPAGRHAGEAAQAEPQAVSPRTLLEVRRVGIQGGEGQRHGTGRAKRLRV